MDDWHNISRDELIAAYFDGELPPEWRAEAQRLLATDPHCRQVLEDLQLIASSLKSLPPQQLEPDFYRHVLQRAEWALLAHGAPAPPATPMPQGQPAGPSAQALAAADIAITPGDAGTCVAAGAQVAEAHHPATRRMPRPRAARWQAPLGVSAAVALAAVALAFWPSAPRPDDRHAASNAGDRAAGMVQYLAAAGNPAQPDGNHLAGHHVRRQAASADEAPAAVVPDAGQAGTTSVEPLNLPTIQPHDLAVRTLAWTKALDATTGELLVVCDVSHSAVDVLQQFESLLAQQQVALISDRQAATYLADGLQWEPQRRAAANQQQGQADQVGSGAGGGWQRRSALAARSHGDSQSAPGDDVHLYVVEAPLEQLSAVIAAVEAMDAGQGHLNVLDPGRRILEKAGAAVPRAIVADDSHGNSPATSAAAAPPAAVVARDQAENASPAALRGDANRAASAGPQVDRQGGALGVPTIAAGSSAQRPAAKGIAQPLALPPSEALQAALASQPASTLKQEMTYPGPAADSAPLGQKARTGGHERRLSDPSHPQVEPLQAPPPGPATVHAAPAPGAEPSPSAPGAEQTDAAPRGGSEGGSWRRAVIILRLHSGDPPPLAAPAPRQP
jgi:hypothetical protein